MSGDADAAITAVVSGRVQGVGFRDYVQTNARILGLRGYVRNQEDGSVETVAEGPGEDLRKFISALNDGPGRVEAVDVEWTEPTGAFRDFAVTW